jgi:hypothetical protein
VSPCCDFFSFFVIAYRFYNSCYYYGKYEEGLEMVEEDVGLLKLPCDAYVIDADEVCILAEPNAGNTVEPLSMNATVLPCSLERFEAGVPEAGASVQSGRVYAVAPGRVQKLSCTN